MTSHKAWTARACGFALSLVAASGLAVSAFAQGAGQASPRNIATYSDALACYQYYAVAEELARKLEKSDKSDADAAAGFQLQAITAKRTQAGWSARVSELSGGRNEAQISADLKKIGEPVITDANEALKGDKTAAQRTASRANACQRLEAAYATR